jgi:hypothetical protein
MARPTSFRLPEELMARLETESRAAGISTTSLVVSILDEGLKTRGFPGIVYRNGPTGRRAGLAGGPDVWEIVRDLQHAPGRGSERIDVVADEIGLAPARIRLAADFYAEYPEEIDRRIEADVEAAERVRRLVDERERLLSR